MTGGSLRFAGPAEMKLTRWGIACALAWLLASGAQADVRVALVTLERGEIAQGVLDLAAAGIRDDRGAG